MAAAMPGSSDKMAMEMSKKKCIDMASDRVEGNSLSTVSKKEDCDSVLHLEKEKEAWSSVDTDGVKTSEMLQEDLPSDAKRRRRMLLETPTHPSNLSSRSESPLSMDSSRSETPTGTLSRAECQNELWRAIGSIDTFLMDQDILEACKSTSSDLSNQEDGAFAGTPNVSFAEFLQQYRELTDWLNQVHKVTQREVTSLSEKYLNQGYHEEMLERSPRREFLNSYSRQLLLRYPHMAEQISARMDRLNTQWTALEQAIISKHGRHDAHGMLRDLECDLNSLRCWLNGVEARLQSLTIQADWTDAELEERLHRHQELQRDIESHNKIVNAVLKLSQRLEEASGRREKGEQASLQLVALNLERRWHGIWLQSLEWQCRLEETTSRRRGVYQGDFDFSGFALPVLDELLLPDSGPEFSHHGLIELDDDSLFLIGPREDLTNSSDEGPTPEQSADEDAEPDSQTGDGMLDCLEDCSQGGGTQSSARPVVFCKPESPLGKRPFPGYVSGDVSPAKRGSQSPTFSSGGVSPVVQGSPLESFGHSWGLDISRSFYLNSLEDENDQSGLKVCRALFDRSSGDSANISETESKMGDSPPCNLPLAGGYVVTSSDGEGDPPLGRNGSKSEGKDIGYSSESPSNDEVDIMRHQIDMEYKFPGKCELATDGPLGDKVTMPSLAVKTDYYCMTLVDIDSTDKTDTGDTTDSEHIRDVQKKRDGQLSEIDKFALSSSPEGSELMMRSNNCLDDSWAATNFSLPAAVSDQCRNGTLSEQLVARYEDSGLSAIQKVLELSESDSASECQGKKSIQYLIDHAEDLVSPRHSCPTSPSKHTAPALSSPSKETQTDLCSTVESSCDASGEDNSDCEALKAGVEEFSTATDDADETLFNSVIHLDTAPDLCQNTSSESLTLPFPAVYDSPRLRKQTGMKPQRRGKKDRPWSVVGLQDDSSSKKTDHFEQMITTSESAIDYLHFNTDNDSSLPFLMPTHTSTFPRENRTRANSADQAPSQKSAKRSLKYWAAPAVACTTSNGSHYEDIKVSEGSTPGTLPSRTASNKLPYCETSSGDRSPPKSWRSRRLRRKSSLEKKEKGSGLSSTGESYDSAEAESESESTEEYLTAPMELPTSDGDDVHNISGSLSENSGWDNYQMLYPTASEDPGEELLTWEPQDDLEFDDDFQLTKQSRSIVTDVIGGGQGPNKLRFTKQGVICDDSDSDLEDFHHILDQSELALKLADQSLRKKRKNPMGTGLHPNPAKYGEIIVTYETNIKCLKNVCQHLPSEDVTDQDVRRVQDLMYQWEKLYALASERHTQAKVLATCKENMAGMKRRVEEAMDCLSFERFHSAEQLKDTISLLKESYRQLEQQGVQVESIQVQLQEFSLLHPTICVDKYVQELSQLHKSTAIMTSKVREHLELLENNWTIWLDYLDSQGELDMLLAGDRERLHNLLCQREYGLKITKKDVLKELETLHSNLSVYESKLSELHSMRATLTQTSDPDAQRQLLASLADLRNQLLVVTQRCRQMYQDVEEDEAYPMDQQSELGKLAVSAAALHEVFKKPKFQCQEGVSPINSSAGVSGNCVSWLHSLPVQVVALMLVAGLVCVLDPDILDRLSNFSLTITPELQYVNGPPTM